MRDYKLSERFVRICRTFWKFHKNESGNIKRECRDRCECADSELNEKIVIEIINKNKVHSPDFLFDRNNFLRENIFI